MAGQSVAARRVLPSRDWVLLASVVFADHAGIVPADQRVGAPNGGDVEPVEPAAAHAAPAVSARRVA
jgi:hypothetical protein